MDHYSALIGAVLGFLAAMVPEVIIMLKERFQHQRQLEEKDQQLIAAREGFEHALSSQNDIIAAQSKQIERLTLLAQEASSNIGVKDMPLLAFLRASVRPMITYSFFGLFAFIKMYAMYVAFRVQGASVEDMLPVLWDANTESLFAAVITFWFGSRVAPAAPGPKQPVPNFANGRNSDGPVVSGEEL